MQDVDLVQAVLFLCVTLPPPRLCVERCVVAVDFIPVSLQNARA